MLCNDHYRILIVGSGCAGLNAADTLASLGVDGVAILTDGIDRGTSRNTGSDKQTYYKLSLAGAIPDSVREMAATLFAGGCIHGDTAVAEAAGSVRAFMKLVGLGVSFPTNRYGEFVGYQTDHDPHRRATSCGPLTSRWMAEALERSVRARNIPILDRHQVVKILCDAEGVFGLVTLSTSEDEARYHIFMCDAIVLATGGPAAIYADSVYPESQVGATGLAIECGARMVNLNQWQYGLASIAFRWNVSGTYQQVLPRYISIDATGCEREFLLDHFTPAAALDRVFLKGYQWPFDTRRIPGSSEIDQLVRAERLKGNRVFLDYRTNPHGLDFSELGEETFTYLENSNALCGTPIDRLRMMNPAAISLYASHGINLATEPLEIAVCAQHCNGGVAVDVNWESTVRGLFVAGEAAGTFGVYRPGGSALNSTQVGAMRAAETISLRRRAELMNFGPHASEDRVGRHRDAALAAVKELRRRFGGFQQRGRCGAADFVRIRAETQRRMSDVAAFLRDRSAMELLLGELLRLRDDFTTMPISGSPAELADAHRFHDTLTTQTATLRSMIFAAEEMGAHGGAMIVSEPSQLLSPGSGSAEEPETRGDVPHSGEVLCVENDMAFFEPIRPMPPDDDWFESVWNEYRKCHFPSSE